MGCRPLSTTSRARGEGADADSTQRILGMLMLLSLTS